MQEHCKQPKCIQQRKLLRQAQEAISQLKAKNVVLVMENHSLQDALSQAQQNIKEPKTSPSQNPKAHKIIE